MRQAVMTAAKTIIFSEKPDPQIEPGHVIVKVLSIGVCGSDIHVYHGLHPYVSYPLVQGHEMSGVIVEVGEGVDNLVPGDLITIEPQRACGECLACEEGLYNICDNLKVIGFQAVGTASDYYLCPAEKIVKLDKEMNPDAAALMEPLAVAVRAVKMAGDIVGKNVLIFGAGPIGNLVAQTAKSLGAAKVMVSEVNKTRLQKAMECGVDVVVNPLEQDLEKEIVTSFGAKRRADVIFECAGVDVTMRTAVQVARKGTPIVVVAVFGTEPAIDMARVNENELKILGTARYVIEDFEVAKELAGSGKVQLLPLVSDVLDFEEYDAAYKLISL